MDALVIQGGESEANESIAYLKKWFRFADKDNDGRLTGKDAVEFFNLSGLPQSELKQIWSLSDTSHQGYLGFWDFVSAMRLISMAQAGKQIDADSLKASESEDLSLPAMIGLEGEMEAAEAIGRLSAINDLPAEAKTIITPVSAVQESSGWFSSKSEKSSVPISAVTSVLDGLKKLYVEKLRPLELAYKFHDFVSPALNDSDFDAKPMVMLLGQYSTGKTTFIQHLLRKAYPGSNIGPEPTTDRFVVVMEGSDSRSIPGNTVAVQSDLPFTALQRFGSAFLSRLEVSQMPHPLLSHVSFVDTPGVLSGEKQRTLRAYDFTGVTEWFADRCDLLLLLFDPHKLDISDEFRRVIASLAKNTDKIRVVLNKAHTVDSQQLMRVYGALMWSLGKVLNTPEVMRVYIGSFSNAPIAPAEDGGFTQHLFEREQEDLMADLRDIPRKSCDRKVNEFVKRARAARINALIVSHLKAQMPMMGRPRAQQKLIDTLGDEFVKIQKEHRVPAGDFPSVEYFQESLKGFDFYKFEKLKPSLIEDVDQMLSQDIPELLRKFQNPYG